VTDIVTRLGNVIMRVRESVYMARQGQTRPSMDGWIGRDAYMQFLRDAEPMLLHSIQPRMVAGEFKFIDVKFKCDMGMEPRSIVICVGGAPVRRLALDFPEYDDKPVVDHPSALALEIMALRYFERGDRSIDPRFLETTIDMINRIPATDEHEPPKMHSVSIERLVELGLVFKEDRGRQIVMGLTLMGREALRQFEAAQ
jgi:hypothetical protein